MSTFIKLESGYYLKDHQEFPFSVEIYDENKKFLHMLKDCINFYRELSHGMIMTTGFGGEIEIWNQYNGRQLAIEFCGDEMEIKHVIDCCPTAVVVIFDNPPDDHEGFIKLELDQ